MINKLMLRVGAQDFVNPYHGKHGPVDYSFYKKVTPFSFGIDEGCVGYREDLIAVDVQGTDENPEWWDKKKGNFNFKLLPYEHFRSTSVEHLGKNNEIKVHSGFVEAYIPGRDMLLEMVMRSMQIYIIGHSRGAGIGTVYARDVKWHVDNVWKTGAQVHLITGGSPRVYNKAGADEFNACGIICVRLRYRNDIVSNTPWPIMGFRHVGKLIVLGRPYIKSPIGIPWDHYPMNYVRGVEKLPDDLVIQ